MQWSIPTHLLVTCAIIVLVVVCIIIVCICNKQCQCHVKRSRRNHNKSRKYKSRSLVRNTKTRASSASRSKRLDVSKTDTHTVPASTTSYINAQLPTLRTPKQHEREAHYAKQRGCDECPSDGPLVGGCAGCGEQWCAKCVVRFDDGYCPECMDSDEDDDACSL